MKKSVILLATLFFTIMMIALIGVNTGLLSRGFKLSSSTKFMIQVNSLLKDVVKLLDAKTSLVKNEATMLILTNTAWSIQEKKASLSINIDIKSNAHTFNINRLKDTNQTIPNTLYGIMETILKAHNVLDSEYFLRLILDSIDSDIQERSYESEIVLLDSKFEQGLILSMDQFMKIVSFYADKVQDDNINKIPWRDIIGFGGDSVDINYMSLDVLSYILLIQKQELKNIMSENKPISDIDAIFSPEDALKLKGLGVKTFVPLVKCFIDIEILDKKAKAIFSYNISSKKAEDVSISTKY